MNQDKYCHWHTARGVQLQQQWLSASRRNRYTYQEFSLKEKRLKMSFAGLVSMCACARLCVGVLRGWRGCGVSHYCFGMTQYNTRFCNKFTQIYQVIHLWSVLWLWSTRWVNLFEGFWRIFKTLFSSKKISKVKRTSNPKYSQPIYD